MCWGGGALGWGGVGRSGLGWAESIKVAELNAVYFRQGLTCTFGLTSDSIDGGQRGTKNGF